MLSLRADRAIQQQLIDVENTFDLLAAHATIQVRCAEAAAVDASMNLKAPWCLYVACLGPVGHLMH